MFKLYLFDFPHRHFPTLNVNFSMNLNSSENGCRYFCRAGDSKCAIRRAQPLASITCENTP